MPNYVDLTSGMVRDWIPVNPSNDSNNMGQSDNNTVVGFYVTVGGAVVFTVYGVDRTVTFPSNFYVSCSGVSRIKATGTTALGIHSLVI